MFQFIINSTASNSWEILSLFRLWLPPLCAAIFGFVFYLWQQKQTNRHILQALHKEVELVYDDCVQWNEGFRLEGIKKKIEDFPGFRPYSVNYVTSKYAIERVIRDLTGLRKSLIAACVQYHYDDSNATSTIQYISSDLWKELSFDQKITVIKDADESMKKLLQSSLKLKNELETYL